MAIMGNISTRQDSLLKKYTWKQGLPNQTNNTGYLNERLRLIWLLLSSVLYRSSQNLQIVYLKRLSTLKGPQDQEQKLTELDASQMTPCLPLKNGPQWAGLELMGLKEVLQETVTGYSLK